MPPPFPGRMDRGRAFSVLSEWGAMAFTGDGLGRTFRGKRIYPYPVPLRLKNPPMKISKLLEKMPDIKLDFFSWGDESFYYLKPEKFFKKTSFRPEDRYAFIFPNYSPGKNFSLIRLNIKETFTRLFPHCINFFPTKSRLLT
jgi:hypothetical protein